MIQLSVDDEQLNAQRRKAIVPQNILSQIPFDSPGGEKAVDLEPALQQRFDAAGYSIEAVIDAFQMGSDLSKKIITKPVSPEERGRLKPLSYKARKIPFARS